MRKIIVLVFIFTLIYNFSVFGADTKDKGLSIQQAAPLPLPESPYVQRPINPAGDFPNGFQSSLEFYDTNNNGSIDSQELKFYEDDKFTIFDQDRDGTLDKKEMGNFDIVDYKLLKGGDNLEQLTEEQKELYKRWRRALLSLALANPGRRAGSNAVNQPDITKCYPDRVCTEPLPQTHLLSQPQSPNKNNNNNTKDEKH
ncbi:MAG: hypothetical protein PHY94_04610 [Candidatus Omnitrophica bacterium]|nr:hypothetical protein [Candidatus Omnitrophota bacterium]